MKIFSLSHFQHNFPALDVHSKLKKRKKQKRIKELNSQIGKKERKKKTVMKDTRQVGEAGAAGNKREEKVGQKEVEAVKDNAD